MVTIDQELCTLCGICSEVCPGNFGRTAPDNGVPPLAPDYLCINCGHCVAVCPAGAVNHRAFPEGSATPMRRESRPDYESLMELLRSRRSVRGFRKDAVGRETILKVLEGARCAPSATNSQSTEYIVVTDPGLLRRIAETTVSVLTGHATGSGATGQRAGAGGPSAERPAADPYSLVYGFMAEQLEAGGDPILHGAPVLIVAHAFSGAGYAGVNASIALQNAVLAAWSLGLGTLWAGYVMSVCRRDGRVPALLGIPEGHQVYGAVALGHPKYEYRRWVERRPLTVTWL